MQSVIDVSHWQTPAQVAGAIAAGATAVFIKATGGLGYEDPEHAGYVKQVRDAGRIVGHYHFAENVSSATAEAAYFLAHAQPAAGDLIALDLEAMDGTWPQRLAYAITWLRAVQSETGARPFWYVNKSWRLSLFGAGSPAQDAALAAFPLWIATVGDSPGIPTGVSGWVLHQYSTAGSLDHDVLALGHDLTDYALPGGPAVALTDLEEKSIAREVWEGAGGHPLGTPSYQQQLYAHIDQAAGALTAHVDQAVAGITVTAAAIDYDLLATKVADLLAARLAS
jgi:lysozyme